MSFSSGLRDKINRNGLPLGKLHCEGHYMGNLMSKLEVLFGASSSYTAPGTPAVGTILCGQSDGTYLSKTMSGDITVSATGVMAIGADKVLPAMVDDDADFVMASLSFATAASSYLKMIERSGDPTNLANYGFVYVKDISNISELFYIDSSGGVTQITSNGALNVGEIPLAQGSIFIGNSSGVSEATDVKTANQFLYGNGTTLVSGAITGDVTFSGGVSAIGSGVIVNDDVKSDAAIAFSKLASLSEGSMLIGNASSAAAALNVKTSGYLLIGDGTTLASVAQSGDVSISTSGVFAISSGVIVNDDVKSDAAIAFSKLASLSSAQILVGNGANVPTAVAVSGDVSLANTGAFTIVDDAIENEMIGDGEIQPRHLGHNERVVDFSKHGYFCWGQGVSGLPSGTTGHVNYLESRGQSFEYHVKGTQTIIAPPWVSGSGANFAMDQTANDGFELSNGNVASGEINKVVGTDNFYFRCRLNISDADGTDALYIGLRKQQTYDAAIATYTDYACMGMNAADGDLMIMTNLNNAGEVDVDTTDTVADADYLDVKIYQGDEAYLQTAYDLANAMKTSLNAHYNDQGVGVEEHDSLQTLLVQPNASSISTLIALVIEMQDSYVSHNADAILASPVIHVAQGGGDALASEVNPTNLSECVTVINDIKAKANLHYADNVAHEDGDTSVVATVDSCNTYFQVYVGNSASGSIIDPSVTLAYNFDSSDEIIPFVYFLQDDSGGGGGLIDTLYLMNWEVVDVETATS